MEENSTDRIRSATFSIARRGYDAREVESFLNKLADWLDGGGADEARRELVRRELERVGQKTAGILRSAEESADQIRAEARDDARKTTDAARAEAMQARKDADSYAAKQRTDADEYASKTRGEADARASATISDAETRAGRIVDEGNSRRRDIETVIGDLEEYRKRLLADLDKLGREAREVAAGHRPARGADRPAGAAAARKGRVKA